MDLSKKNWQEKKNNEWAQFENRNIFYFDPDFLNKESSWFDLETILILLFQCIKTGS